MQLLVATRNAHKLEEMQRILNLPDMALLGLRDVPDAPEIVEDGDTFEANAAKKASIIAAHCGGWTLADDSGLEVDALGGAPGVYSARYAGEPCDDAANNRKLLAALEGVTDRTARFRCVIALCSPEGTVQTVDGRCEGNVAMSRRGEHGFGYDPLFIPDGYDQSFGELPPEVKHRISHRARALQAALPLLDAMREG